MKDTVWFIGGCLLALMLTSVRFAGASAFERIPVGARANGMGGAYSAVADDPSATYWNPAGLMGVKRSTIMLSHQDIASLNLISYDQFIYAQPFVFKNAVAFSWYRLATTSLVTFMNYSENTFQLSFAQTIIDELSVGLNYKIMQVQYTNSAGGYGFDFGMRYQPIKEVAVSVVADNCNYPELYWLTGTYERLPLNLHAGVAAYLDPNTILSVEGDKLLEDKQEIRLGGELRLFEQILTLRAGVVYLMLDGGKYMPTAGMGFKLAFMEFSYAYTTHYDLDGTHIFSLNWGF